jgi:hypothetical protein
MCACTVKTGDSALRAAYFETRDTQARVNPALSLRIRRCLRRLGAHVASFMAIFCIFEIKERAINTVKLEVRF